MQMKALLAALSGFGLLALMVACQSAVNLDVQYTDAGLPTAPPPTSSDSGTLAEADPPVVPAPVLGEELQGCPCDATQGLACCVSNPANGVPFCTTDQGRCNAENGAFFRCFGPDPNTESVCCLHRNGATSESALAAVCRSGSATVCRVDADCPGVAKACTITTCPGGVSIGVCDANPVCPP